MKLASALTTLLSPTKNEYFSIKIKELNTLKFLSKIDRIPIKVAAKEFFRLKRN